MLLHCVKQGEYVHPPSILHRIGLFALKHLQHHLGHGHVGQRRRVDGSSLSSEGSILIADLRLDGLRAVRIRTYHFLQLFLNHRGIRGEIGILASSSVVDGFPQ